MINKGLFSKLYIEDVRSSLKLDDLGEGRMATLSQTWNTIDAASRESLWDSSIKKALGYLEFVPPSNSPNANGLLPLYDDWNFANCVCVFCLVGPQQNIDDIQLGRFWPGKLISELKRRKLHWGILSDGTHWRLYCTESSKPYEDYVELDLSTALKNQDDQEYALFEHFFHAGSFMAEEADDQEEVAKEKAAGVYKCLLDRKREESESTLERAVKTPFLFQIDEVLQYLCNGFIHDTRKTGEEYTEEERRQIFESAVKLLYRCLFLFYAESRSLLPSERAKAAEYGVRSIRALCREAHKFRWSTRDDLEEYGMWKHLKGLTNAVNDGDPDYGIIGYNGGLFDDDEERFLGQHRIRNDYLARALYLLSYVEPFDADPKNEYEIPYEDLEVRHLGELYENILEFNVTLADADRVRRRSKNGVEILLLSETETRKGDTVIKKGEVYFGETALERKQSGSYYTPESLVHFLNYKAIIKPLNEKFAKHRERLEEFLSQTGSSYDQSTKRGALKSAIALVERFVQEEVLKFKVCDLAMGSGHFLVNAANQMTDFVVALFDELPQQEEVTAEISCDPNYWRRLITRHCLYGVDINALSTHLAKLSLWLNCFARDHKLTFLDHHLRCGNSLVGVRTFHQLENFSLRNGEQKKKNSQSLTLPFPNELKDRLLATARSIAGIAQLDEDDTDRQKDLYDEATHAAIKYIAPLADLHTAYLMVQTISNDDYWNLFRAITKEDFDAINDHPEMRKVWHSIKKLRDKHDFFHWMLEFPDVFSVAGTSGFDSTVGNPPWDIVKPNSQEFFSAYIPEFRRYNKQEANNVSKRLLEQNETIRDHWEEYCNSFVEQSSYVRELSAYSALGNGDINTFKLFLEQFFSVLKSGGHMGIVVPSSLYTDQGCQPLREMFFNKSRIQFLYCFENRWPTVFSAVDGRFKFIVFCTEKGKTTDSFKCSFMQHDPEKLPVIEENAIRMSVAQVKKFSPHTLSIMEPNNEIDIKIMDKMFSVGIPLVNLRVPPYELYSGYDFHMTKDSNSFIPIGKYTGSDSFNKKDYTPLYEGKMINIFDSEFDKPRFIVSHKSAGKNAEKRVKNFRLAFRPIARSTDVRTLISTIIPRCYHGNSLITFSASSNRYLLYLCSLFSSFSLDFILRRQVSANVNMHYVESLPIPTEEKHYYELLVACAAKLICWSPVFSDLWDSVFKEEWALSDFWYPGGQQTIENYGPVSEIETRMQLYNSCALLSSQWTTECGIKGNNAEKLTGYQIQIRSEIDAIIAIIFGLSRFELSYVLESFPVLQRKENQIYGEFISKRKCLEEYDRIAKII